MRRLLPLLLALLAACQVDVEGAPCRIGSAGDCPSGQGCGLDERCSVRAASCALCTPDDVRCEGTKIQRCSAASDPVCGAWETTTRCEEAGLVCGEKSGAPSCECAEVADGVFWADPAGGKDPSLVATGALEPPACRMPRLTDALAKASMLVAGNGVVRSVPSSEAVLVFEEESFPVRIPTNVILEASTTATIRAGSSSTVSALVELHGALRGFRIENVDAKEVGIDARCVGSTPPEMRDVILDGASTLAKGIVVSGSCGSHIEDVFVLRAKDAALVVDASPEAVVTVLGGRFAESGVGVELRGGTLEIERGAARTEIASNLREGLLISGSSGLRARATQVDIVSNYGTGVVIEAVPATAELSLNECRIRSNGFAAARIYGLNRTAGGMLVAQTSNLAAFSFTGNTVFANAGDQVGVWSEGAWSFSGGECGVSSNAFGCIGTGAYALYATSRATVDATFNVWSSDPPTLIVNGVSYSPVCTGHAAAPAAPACPAE